MIIVFDVTTVDFFLNSINLKMRKGFIKIKVDLISYYGLKGD